MLQHYILQYNLYFAATVWRDSHMYVMVRCQHTFGHIVYKHRTYYTPMSKWWYEIKTAVHSVIQYVLPVESTFISEILLKLLINVVRDGLPTGKHTHTRTDRGNIRVARNIYPFSITASSWSGQKSMADTHQSITRPHEHMH